MKTITTSQNVVIEFFDATEEGSVDRYRMLQQSDMELGGVGWTKADHLARLNSVRQWIARKDIESAMTELDNAVISFHALLSGVDLNSQATACLLHSINGQIVTEATVEGLAAALKPHLPFINQGELTTLGDTVKKNYMPT